MARAVLVTDADALVTRVARARAPAAALPRRAIAAEALLSHGALVVVGSLDDALELANRLAPEHLELLVRVPQALLPRVRHAGAVFVGGQTPEVVGDYVAGPSHVLPTAGTARFSSPLGVGLRQAHERTEYRGRPGRGVPAPEGAHEVEADRHGRAADVRLNTERGKRGGRGYEPGWTCCGRRGSSARPRRPTSSCT
jgi:histidinol dehydrogenase